MRTIYRMIAVLLIALAVVLVGCQSPADAYVDHVVEYHEALIVNHSGLSEIQREAELYALAAADGMTGTEADDFVRNALSATENEQEDDD